MMRPAENSDWPRQLDVRPVQVDAFDGDALRADLTFSVKCISLSSLIKFDVVLSTEKCSCCSRLSISLRNDNKVIYVVRSKSTIDSYH